MAAAPPRPLDSDLKEAKNFLRGQDADIQATYELAKRLKNFREFGIARRVLNRLRLNPKAKEVLDMRKLHQQQALCTYKDPNLHAELKFDLAFETLCGGDEIKTTTDQETLGIAGAIHKYKWESFGQRNYLEQSLSYYIRGYNVGPESDFGYTGINSAFVLDLLASLQEQDLPEGARAPGTVAERRQEARRIREALVDCLPKLQAKPGGKPLDEQWWFVVTLAEAHFGLGHYPEAKALLLRATGFSDVAKWEYETAARQLATLARLQKRSENEDTDVWDVLEDFLGGAKDAVRSAFLGRVGLALSGGGFRASLFHIGLLAKLAELDVLRHVEFISCVSGGSIVGMYYYLEVRELLQRKPDSKIERQDYIDIVHRMVEKFRLGVQQNIRTRVIANLPANFRMLRENYTRTNRAGELYESELYSRIDYAEKPRPQYMKDLKITPMRDVGDDEAFDPKLHNWRRKAKVPILVINATALNTGHNFQFTATWMGEPPSTIDSEVDVNYRLRRMWYSEAPDEYDKVRIGDAVGASACVPGVFEPIPFGGLYRDRARNQDLFVRLVDGGVHDNQGTASLLDQDCRILLVSDASGQMISDDNPAGGFINPLLRTNSIFQSRLREAEFRDLDGRRNSSLLRGVMFIHLKKDLIAPVVDWKDTKDPYASEDPSVIGQGILTKYGVDRELQLALSAIRTDLDSFSDAEAFALMASAYRMTEYEFPRSIKADIEAQTDPVVWEFNKIAPAMNREDETAYQYLKWLAQIGSQPAFKVWRMSRGLSAVGIVFLVVNGAALAWLAWTYRDYAIITWGQALASAVVLAAGFVFGKTVMRIVRFRETLRRIAMTIGLGIVGCALANLHLRVFDRKFLKLGHLDRVFEKSKKKSEARQAV